MIVTISEQFTSDPSERERPPTIICKPGLRDKRQVFKPKRLLLTDVDHLLTREGPEKVGSFYSKTLTLITETGQKQTHPCIAQSLL